MRALVQRVQCASVDVCVDDSSETVGAIAKGMCVLLGVTHSDTIGDAQKLAEKLCYLRIFDDDNGVMNCCAHELALPMLVISQFTLYGDSSRGRRPSWIAAARPEVAEPLIDATVEKLRSFGIHVETGRFRTEMHVSLINDGPVTLLLET